MRTLWDAILYVIRLPFRIIWYLTVTFYHWYDARRCHCRYDARCCHCRGDARPKAGAEGSERFQEGRSLPNNGTCSGSGPGKDGG